MAKTDLRDVLLDQNKFLDPKYQGDEKRNPDEINLSGAGPYNINQFVYPEELTTKADLQNYVTFYVNVRGKTKFKPTNYVDVDISRNGQNLLAREAMSQSGEFAVAAGAAIAAGAAVNKVLGGASFLKLAQTIRKSGGTFKQAAVGALLPAAAGAATGVAAYGGLELLKGKSDNLKIDEPRRITDAIMLPVEGIPEVRYSMQYDAMDYGIIGGLMGGSSAIESQASGRAAEGSLNVLLGLASLPQKLSGLGPDPKQAILAGGAVQTNPFREVFFKSIDFRSFSFNYTFLPKSEAEVYNVKRIIDLFKFHMHPELSKDGLFYVYPSEFEMVYYFRGKRNNFIHKISTCVLKNMDVKYGGEYFATFVNGAPAEIKLRLEFQELELLTKERIAKGY